MVAQKEIIKALRLLANWHDTGQADEKRFALASRIEAEGIAPPDGLELIADIDGIGCCTVVIRNGRVNIAAETVRDIINIGIAPPDGFRLVPWKTLDGACELLELHGEHEHPDYKALKATTSAKVKGVSDEQ